MTAHAALHSRPTDPQASMMVRMVTRMPPWKKPAPRKRGPSQPLSETQKSAARQRAKENGRRYPNLIDNMWAASLPRGDEPAETR